jgi:ketosteroid isomerase-like protein
VTDHGELVRTAIGHLEAHDIERYVAVCTADVVSTTPLGTARGRVELAAYLQNAFDGIPDHWRRIERLVVSGDDVATWVRFGGTAAATGRSFELEGCTVFGVRDGLISSITEYVDLQPAYEAFTPD